MGSISAGRDPHTMTLDGFEEPEAHDGVVEIEGTFRGGIGSGYPVWTENKAKLIQRYVRYFLMITKHGTYIDGFAGPQVEAYNDDAWSAKRVLEIEPPWLRRFILCDIDSAQAVHLRQLVEERRQRGDQRNIEVHQGDFNHTVHQILVPGAIREKEATFCLLDQRTFECKWSTVKAIASYKQGGNKIELFYFLPVGWLARSIKALKDHQIK